jgi:hypothetical protein
VPTSIAVALVTAVALGAWSRWLIQRARAAGWWYVPAALAAILVPGLMLLSTTTLIDTFEQVGIATAEARQYQLAHGIHDAMLFQAGALAVGVVWVVVLIVGTIRQGRGEGAQAAQGATRSSSSSSSSSSR